MNNQNRRTVIFGVVVALALVVAIGYVLVSRQRPQSENLFLPPLMSPTQQAQGTAATLTTVPTTTVASLNETQMAGNTHVEAPGALPARPFLVSLNLLSDANIGKVRVATLDSPQEIAWIADLHCERVYFGRDKGLCLSRIVEAVSAYSVATLFDSSFRPISQFKTDGIPSRTRVSRDGRYAAFTVFVFGHSYADENFSTATFILDTNTGESLGNLEEFSVFEEGKQISFPDFNFWGVTFTEDSNFFYATLRFNRTPYLVKGDIQARTVTILYKGVECPSLSPDETRIAFKKLISRLHWQLTIMDLATFAETPLAEVQSVDDQAEWLDNEHVLYGISDPNLPAARSIMVVNADGSGEPRLFAPSSESPAVVR